MPVGSSNAPFIQQMLIQAYFVAKLAKLVGRFSSISLDLLSIFSTTNKTCKEIVKEEKFSYKCWHSPAQMSCLRSFCRKNVKNGIYALRWVGLTQKVDGGQVRWFWGWELWSGLLASLLSYRRALEIVWRSDTKKCKNGQFFAFRQIERDFATATHPGHHHVKADVLTFPKMWPGWEKAEWKSTM